MDGMISNRELAQQDKEHAAWLKAFNAFCQEMKIDAKEGNKKKYREFFCTVENWGQEYARLRIMQKEEGSFDVMAKDGRLFVSKNETQ